MSEKKGLERYKIIGECGEGGMGKIYLAEDLNLKRRVALKQAFESTDAEVLKIAEKEARTLANLKHPNLPTVYDYFVENNVQFIVMEYITGKNLGEIMKENQSYFTAAKIAETMTTLLNVADYLHKQNPPIIHRDIKPQNIKISDDGGLYLLDFGLVKNAGLNSPNTTNLMLSSKLFGFSQNYSPLEQRKGEQTSVAADIYSLCATLYFLYTKTTPADSLDRADIRSKGQSDPLPNIRSLNPNIPPRVAEMIMAGLELHRENRPSAIVKLRRILEGGATRIPNFEPGFQSNEPNFQQFPSSRFQVSFHDEPKKVEELKPVFHQIPYQQPGKKSWLAYALPLLLVVGALGFFGYENWCYAQNKAIGERLEKAAIDNFDIIESEWKNYEESLARTSYFQWGIKEAEDKLQQKIFGFADNIIEDYRTNEGKVKKDETFWQKPQRLLEKILAISPNNNEVKAKIAYLQGQKDFAFAFEKGGNKQTLLESAQKHYREATRLNSKFGDPYFMTALTHIYGRNRDYSRALENIELATKNGFPFDTRTKAVKADCFQALADATVKKEEKRLKDMAVTTDDEARKFLDELEESLKTVRDKYIAAKSLYEEAKGYGTVDKSLKAINKRLEKLNEGISAADKLRLVFDVINMAQNQEY